MIKKDEKIYLKAIGHRVSLKRKDLKITQAEMAERVSLSTVQLHRIENGTSPTSILTLRRISQELGEDISNLVKEKSA